jgi:hypothetical protein
MTYEEAFQLVEELLELAKKQNKPFNPGDVIPGYFFGYGYLKSRLAQVMVECPMARVSTVRHIEYLKSL